MPYSSIQDLPDDVKKLPKHGQEIFLAAFNSAYDGTCKDNGDRRESCAFGIGWAAVKNKYHKVGDEWKQKEDSNESKSILHSVLKDKPKFDNGVWVPFLKENQLAEDNQGRKYRITKEAIDNGYKSYIGGFININHQDKIKGKIAEVKRDGEFAYFKAEGLDEEALAVINSPAYRGVSQQSLNLMYLAEQKDGLIDVISLQGTGVAIALYPKTPGCPLTDGCGIPLKSTEASEASKTNFSLNSDVPISAQISSNEKINGGIKGVMTDFTKEHIEDMLKFMQGHPDMMTDGMKGMMKGMSCTGTQSTVTTPAQSIPSIAPQQTQSTVTQPAAPDTMKEIEGLKKTIQQLTEQNTMTIRSALEARDEEYRKRLAADEEYKQTVSELRSVVRKDILEKMLASKPSIDVLKSNLEVLRASGLTIHVGAGRGVELSSTEEQKIKEGLQKLHIPRIEFADGVI